MGKAKRETPVEAFENLRQAFDVLKENHSDPWCWHEYLAAQGEDEDSDDDDPELTQLKPKKRSHMERLKTHLLTCVSELNRCAQAADTCYYHMCCSPDEMKPCVIVLGTSGDVDEDMLNSGDASPQKIMAGLQKRLSDAHEKICLLEDEIRHLKIKLADTRYESKDRWQRWQQAAMLSEDAMTKLSSMAVAMDESRRREEKLRADYHDLHLRHVRASRMMIYKGRQMLRDQVFKVYRKENLFYAFHGFIGTLATERDDRTRREHEAQRDRVEFSLRNEVRLLLWESDRSQSAMARVTVEAGRLKQARRSLACRFFLYKNRPYENAEYLKWIWELWSPVRPVLALEKALERETSARHANVQQLVLTTSQLPPLAQRIDQLLQELVAEKLAHDISKRELTASGATQLAYLVEHLRDHRHHELHVLHRMHEVDVADKKERIAVLEREIAEDKHIHALKGMVVDLESNLRKALDRRKQRAFVVPQNTGTKCPQCSRENLYRSWRGPPQETASTADLLPEPGPNNPPEPGLRTCQSLGSLQADTSQRFMMAETPSRKLDPLKPQSLKATYSAVWR